jgi:hypothetical protein
MDWDSVPNPQAQESDATTQQAAQVIKWLLRGV